MNTYPHELAPLLVAVGRAGIELAPHSTDSGRLRHRPADLPPDLASRLRTHRTAVLGLLVDGYAPDPRGDTDAGYIMCERLGVADGLGMPTHPGSAAWLVAVGEAWGGGAKSLGPRAAGPEPAPLARERGFSREEPHSRSNVKQTCRIAHAI